MDILFSLLGNSFEFVNQSRLDTEWWFILWTRSHVLWIEQKAAREHLIRSNRDSRFNSDANSFHPKNSIHIPPRSPIFHRQNCARFSPNSFTIFKILSSMSLFIFIVDSFGDRQICVKVLRSLLMTRIHILHNIHTTSRESFESSPKRQRKIFDWRRFQLNKYDQITLFWLHKCLWVISRLKINTERLGKDVNLCYERWFIQQTQLTCKVRFSVLKNGILVALKRCRRGERIVYGPTPKISTQRSRYSCIRANNNCF